MEQNKIERINELYKKSKTVGLTEEEKTEQQVLRKAYLEAIRQNFTATLDSIIVVDENGTQTPLSEIKSKDKN